MTFGGRMRAGALGLVGTLGAIGGWSLIAPSPAHASQDMALTCAARYVVSGDGRPVTVSEVVTVTSQKASTAAQYFYLTEFHLWLPDGPAQLQATSNGSAIPVASVKYDGQDFAAVSFPSPLNFGQSRTFTVTYTIPHTPPRSSLLGRVGPGYAAFEVFCPGDAGQARIDIVAPRWMTLDLGVPHTDQVTGDTRVTTATGGGPDGLWSQVSLRDPSQVVRRTVLVDHYSFSVEGFPGDAQWTSYVASRLPATVRGLEQLTGLPWPTASTTITEDYSNEVYGWDGQYNQGAVTVSEALNPALLTHELSHSWSNFHKLDERWLTEGLAQELTTQVMSATGGKDEPHVSVSPSQKGAFPLANWVGAATASQLDHYGYPASWRVLHALVAGSTSVPHRQLFRDLLTHTTPYDVPGDAPLLTHSATWRQAYDLFEVVGGNRQTRTVMSTWVLSPSETTDLTTRAAARRSYAAADQSDGSWAPPRGVRIAMADWDFAEAGRQLALSRGLAGLARDAQQASKQSGVDAKAMRAAYQSADDTPAYTHVAQQLASFARQTSRYAALRHDLDSANPLARLGRLVVNPADRLVAARVSIEKGDGPAADRALQSAQTRSAAAPWVGVGLIVVVIALLWAPFALARRRRSATLDRTAWSGDVESPVEGEQQHAYE